MSSVTAVASKTKQPQGGYLPMKCFNKEVFGDFFVLNESENIHASLVGLAVDYLTRFELGDPVEKAFEISCIGAYNVGMLEKANVLMANITGLDDHSIISACKLVGFDVCYRFSPSSYKPIESINPDISTIENIRIMVWRSIAFWNKYGPVVCSEPTFEGGYTDTVKAGDGDFLSSNTLWDFKVSKNNPTTKHSLQILMYYVMGLHSVHDHFKSIDNLGFFNPRLNIAYICPVSLISDETIKAIEDNVLCYGITSCTSQEEIVEDPLCDYTVLDICNEIGIGKNQVLADIHSGKLIAYMQSGKYFIDYYEALDYIEYKMNTKRKKNGKKRFHAISLIAMLLFLILIFYILSQMRIL